MTKEMKDPKTKELKEAFTMFDRDKDGLINYNELGNVLKSQGFNPTNQELLEMIADVDENEDDKINFEEFLILMHSRLKKADIENELNEAFSVYDKNGSGIISVREFKKIMNSLGEKVCEEEVEEIIQKVDPKNRGYINYKDLTRIIVEQ
jgi:calmodulin